MIIRMVRGCIHDSLSVDGNEEIKLTDEERMEVLRKVFDQLRPQDLNNVLQEFVQIFGEYECDDEPCETCGDYVETYIWEI